MDIRIYTEERDTLAASYDKLCDIAAMLNNDKLCERIKKSRAELLAENFKLVVVGEFSRGKSTFINAMLGKRLLPAKTNPTTTTINRISYSDEAHYILHYRHDDKCEEISESDFKKIIAVELFDDDEESLREYRTATMKIGEIAYVDIHYPVEICQNGIEIYDTPGTNDLDQAREEITLKFIPQADAAIMLLSAEQILSRSEMDFIKDRILKNDIQKIFFVINFKDRLDSPEDGERIISLAKTQLSTIVERPKVFLLSSKEALNYRRDANGEAVKGVVPDTLEETGFLAFEKSLSEYLVSERSISKLAKHRKRLSSLGEDLIRESVAVRRDNLGADAVELEKRLTLLRPRIERARNRSYQLFGYIKDSTIPMAVNSLSASYRRGLERIARQAVMAVHSYKGEMSGEALAHSLEKTVAPLQQEHYHKMNDEVAAKLREMMQSVEMRLQEIWDEYELLKSSEIVPAAGDGYLSPHLNLNGVSTRNADWLGGSMFLGGIILAVNAPLIALPVAFLGGKNLLRLFESYRTADFLSRAAEAVRIHYTDIATDQSDEFYYRILDDFQVVANNMEGMIDHQIASGMNEIERLIAEMKQSELDSVMEAKRLNGIESDIKMIIAKKD